MLRSGGQVGDTGFIEYNGQKIAIIDTKNRKQSNHSLCRGIAADPKATLQVEVNI